jgi:hypothetical protein
MEGIWFAELNRIMKPGAVILITLHGKGASDGLDAEGLKALQVHGFVHRRSQKLKGLVPDWYHTTWQSREYVVNPSSSLNRPKSG